MMDGFFELIPRKAPEAPKPVSKKPSEKKLPKFKKGSWKYELLKRLKHWKSGPKLQDFHFTMVENLVVCKGDDPVVLSNKGGFKVKKLEKLAKQYGDDVYILINCMDNVFMKFSVESYLKLIQIDKMVIDFTLEGNVDDKDVYTVNEEVFVIDNITCLARFINRHRQGIEGVYEMLSNCGGFAFYDFKFKVVVMKRDGSCDTYKSDFNDFMKDYGLRQF